MSHYQSDQSDKNMTRFHSNGVVSNGTRIDLEHICVCVCTYQRPKMLADLLDGLIEQKTHGQFSYSVIIVDNDPLQSAKEVVHNYISDRNILIEYHHKATKGLTYARNKSLQCATGNYIAFIDDDEKPVPDWLYHLYKTLKDYKADAAFGSVLPTFEVPPPEWILNQKFFYWRDVRKGTGVDVGTAVTTNNALVRRDLIVKYNLEFDHDFAFAGGEDQAFFFELMDHKKDAKYISCEKAVVHELITSNRCDPEYIRKRFLLEGSGRAFGIHKFTDTKRKRVILTISQFFSSLTRTFIFSLLLFLFFSFNKDASRKYYYKIFYHIGVLTAILNISPYSDRKSIGLL